MAPPTRLGARACVYKPLWLCHEAPSPWLRRAREAWLGHVPLPCAAVALPRSLSFKASVALPRGHRRGYAAREKRGSAMRRCGSATRLGACAVQHVALPQVVKSSATLCCGSATRLRSVARPCVAASVALPRGRGFSLGENLGYLEPKFFNYPKSQENLKTGI